MTAIKLTIAAIIAFAVLSGAAIAQTNCRTHTYFVNGQMMMCTTCCYGGTNCNTTCI